MTSAGPKDGTQPDAYLDGTDLLQLIATRFLVETNVKITRHSKIGSLIKLQLDIDGPIDQYTFAYSHLSDIYYIGTENDGSFCPKGTYRISYGDHTCYLGFEYRWKAGKLIPQVRTRKCLDKEGYSNASCGSRHILSEFILYRFDERAHEILPQLEQMLAPPDSVMHYEVFVSENLTRFDGEPGEIHISAREHLTKRPLEPICKIIHSPTSLKVESA